jgi:radical SAM superfamily enzyme YgiQ (UPF0313 family)
MTFLLVGINAKYIHSNPALYSLQAYAGEEPSQYVDLAEYTINQTKSSILADIYRRNPDAVGFSCYIWNISMILDIARDLAQIRPNMPIWLGGPEVSYDSERLLETYSFITGIIAGEGEAAFRDLLLTYQRQMPIQNKSGVVADVACDTVSSAVSDGVAGVISDGASDTGYGAVSGVIYGTCITHLEDIPFIYEGSLLSDSFRHKIIYYESSRGCPFHCAYCLSGGIGGLHFRDIEVVKKELGYFLAQKVKQVKFVDRTFNAKKSHAIEIWEYLLEHDNGVTNFHFEIAADLLDEEEIACLGRMRPGLVQLEIGVQTTNPLTLEAIDRATNQEVLKKNVLAIQKNRNIHQHLDLIAGLPYEDYESFGRSFNWVYNLHPQQLQLGFLKVLKGSPLALRAGELGLVYSHMPPYEILATPHLPYDDLLRLKQIEALLDVYYNSGQFTRTLSRLEEAYADPFSLYEDLAAFWHDYGLGTDPSSRESRYEALLAFVGHTFPTEILMYRELLLYDMYLRENLKSRPKFAFPQESYKEEIRQFYRQEALSPKYLKGYDSCTPRQLQRMTHIEYFQYTDPPGYVLFDYQNTDPLTSNAQAIAITMNKPYDRTN